MPSRDGLLIAPAAPLLPQVLLLHVLAWASVLLAAAGLAWSGTDIGALALVLLQGAAAWGLSFRLELPRWWQWINLGFFPAAWLALQAELSPAWYLAGFALLALTQWGAVSTRVPLYLTGRRAREEVARRLAGYPGGSFLDLGCGTGGLLAHLARSNRAARLHGVETAPLPWLASRLRLGRRAEVRLGDLRDEGLAGHDVVYAFLSPEPMARLWQQARREMRPGSLFISNSFAVPGIEPDETVELDGGRQTRLLIWRMR